MAKATAQIEKNESGEYAIVKPHERKRCPQCGATVFQGPSLRGEIVDGQFVPRETLFTCVNCHAVRPLDQLETFSLLH